MWCISIVFLEHLQWLQLYITAHKNVTCQSDFIHPYNVLSSVKQLSPFKSILIVWHTMTDSDSRAGAGVRFAGVQPADWTGHDGCRWGDAPVLNYSPHIHLAVPIIQDSVHERSLPASPSCEKWVMEFKGTRSLVALHSRWHRLRLSVPPNMQYVCVCNSVSRSEIREAVWECVSVNQKTSIITFSAGIKAAPRSPRVFLSLSVSSLNLAYILPHDFPLEIKIYECRFAAKLTRSLTDRSCNDHAT